MPQILSPAALVTLDGVDATAFAHAQFCTDVAGLDQGQWQWSGWLDAQGRARYFFSLLRVSDSRLIAWLPSGDAAQFSQQLAAFVFRSRVKLDAPTGWSLLQGDTSRPPAPDRRWLAVEDGFQLDVGVVRTRTALLVPGISGTVDEAASHAWQRADVADGLPLLATPVSGMFVPQALGFERLGALSHDKGCYPGQEIVARLHFRGGNKRHPYRITVDADTLPLPGDGIGSANSPSSGTILYAAPGDGHGFTALAVMPEALVQAGALTTESGAAVAVAMDDLTPA